MNVEAKSGSTLLRSTLVLLLVLVGTFFLVWPKIQASVQAIVTSTSRSHAETRHPVDEVTWVRNCMEDPNLKHYRFYAREDKFVDVCMDEQGKTGFRPQQDSGDGVHWDEITAYIRTDITSFDQLQKYCNDWGYRLYTKVGELLSRIPWN